jgi:hypothetical protein
MCDRDKESNNLDQQNFILSMKILFLHAYNLYMTKFVDIN